MQSTEPVAAYRENLPPGKLIDFPYTSLDRLGVPAYSTAFWPEDGAFCNGLGYGTREAEAMASAFGELFESAAACERLPLMPRTRGSYDELVRRHGEGGVLDPLRVCLEAGTAYDRGRVLDWVEARRFPEGEAVLVPVELAATRFADLSPREQERELLFTPITNGLGAGPSLEHALSHALLELVQRDGNSVDYRALDRGIAVSTETSDSETRDLLAHLDREGVEVIVKLATSDLGMSNLYVVSYDRNPEDAPHPLVLSACGEAAHPSRELALRKALLEYVAARAQALQPRPALDDRAGHPPRLPRPLSGEPPRQRGRPLARGDAPMALPLPQRDVRLAGVPRPRDPLPRRVLGPPAHRARPERPHRVARHSGGSPA